MPSQETDRCADSRVLWCSVSVAVLAGVSGEPALAQSLPVPGMSSDDMNTALDFAKAGYASGRYVWWTKGPTGFLTDETLPANRNMVYRDCTETR
ncbi:hypothetical protein [Ralstonia syzygii]|uniref:hypothetical protein n=1 Tax=Ralstonia syzygii TaxID=28097 RepID=UPI001E4873ED|nr:hypothetical protein [Ralstonia syzygii]